MKYLFQPLLYMVASCTENQLIRKIEFLKAENEMLRQRVPQKRVFLKPNEKARLVQLGQAVGSGLGELITIVTYRTFQRWLHDDKQPKKPRKTGRPRTAEAIRDLVVRLASETGWGYTRILGELKKLGISSVSQSTVISIIKAHGFDPGPQRGTGPWDEFLKIHAETLWQCDFFSKRIWTATGLRQYFVLVFLHVDSRKVFCSEACLKPNAAWMQKQTASFVNHIQSCAGPPAALIFHDCDGMFTKDFDATLQQAGLKVRRVGPRAPNMNAYVERWIQSVQHECLDHFLVFGEDHFNYVISEYVRYYHEERPHQSKNNLPLSRGRPPREVPDPSEIELVCHTWLGGLLKHHERNAA